MVKSSDNQTNIVLCNASLR